MSRTIFFFKVLIFKIILISCFSKEFDNQNYISIPFNIQVPDSNLIVDSQSFLQNYYSKKIIFDFSIGKNSQSVNGILSQDESCFNFIDKNSDSALKNINFFSPKNSDSFRIRKEKIYHTYSDDEIMAIGSDIYNFNKNDKYNLSFLFFQTVNEDEINYDEIKNKQYMAKIGLVLEDENIHLDSKCPKFFVDSYKIANLSKYLISFEFTEANKGNFIYGNEMYIYNKKKYHESQYIGTHTSKNHQIYFNKAFLLDKSNNEINITEGTYSVLNYNLGVIIGTSVFKKKISENYFDSLDFCKNELVQFNNSEYYVYSCNGDEDKIKLFPKIIFTSKNYEYNFELNYNDLFIKFGSRYYFLIIFRNKDENTWTFGQPFYKKFNLTIHLKENWIGLYNPNKPIIEDEGTNGGGKGVEVKKIVIIIALVIFVIGLAIGMFFLGRKMKNDRKKRANELLDDNYEYSGNSNSIGIDS